MTDGKTRYRIRAGIGVVSIALAGAAWSGCGGDDTEDQLDEAANEINEALDQTEQEFQEEQEKAEQQADEALEESGLEGGGKDEESGSAGPPGGYGSGGY